MADSSPDVTVRRARTSDIPRIKHLVDTYAGKILLEKNLVTLYEAVQEFWVAERGGTVIGCGALHVLWADLGEVRTVAVDPAVKGEGVGHAIVDRLLAVARELELERLFVLTFETEFFGRHGFAEIEGTPVTAEVFEEMCRSYDIGVAEFLDLSYVKPNILGNTRMLLVLLSFPRKPVTSLKVLRHPVIVIVGTPAPDRRQGDREFLGLDQHIAGLGALRRPDDAVVLHQVHQPAGLGEADP